MLMVLVYYIILVWRDDTLAEPTRRAAAPFLPSDGGALRHRLEQEACRFIVVCRHVFR